MSTIDTSRGGPLGMLASSGRQLAYAGVTLPMAGVCLAALVAGWAIVLPLSITPLVVPLLVGFAALLERLARVESALARSLLGATIAPSPRPERVDGYWAKAGSTLRTGAFWRRQAFCLLRMLVGLPLACLSISLVVGGLGYAAAPIYYRWIPQDHGGHGIDLGFWSIDTLAESLVLVPAGLLVTLLGVAVLHLSAMAWRALAEQLLPRVAAAASAPAALPEPAHRWAPPSPGSISATPRQLPRTPPSWTAVFAHAAAASGVVAVALIVWGATGAGYPWPFWVALPLTAGVALHASVTAILRRSAAGWSARVVTPALAIHATVMAVLELVLVAVWAATWRGYPWWLWTALGLAVSVAAHWVVVLSGSMWRLEQRRSQAVDVQESDLRRIERDLHDGAQARLVALGLHLGMAEQKLTTDPDAARALIGEARDGVQTALTELRDLVRGIRPPVLTDRGLEAAIWSLVDRSALPVDVHGSLDERVPDAIETAAYFVVAEALANAGKYAAAGRIDVRLDRRGTILTVDVSDDGRGGADPGGSGLAGLRRRVEAVGGRLTISSHEGDGTIVHAEFPCGR